MPFNLWKMSWFVVPHFFFLLLARFCPLKKKGPHSHMLFLFSCQHELGTREIIIVSSADKIFKNADRL